MAPTPHILCLIVLLELLLGPTSAQLSRDLKQELLDLHNGARRNQPADNMRAIEWMTSLADQAQRVSSQCTEAPPDQSELTASLSDQYSWIGLNKHFIASTDSSLITIDHARESFQCWSNGNTENNCQYSSTEDREQLFYPDTHVLGCGAKYFSGSDRCHVLGVGVMVVCLYAPGSVSGFRSATGISCRNCPTVAPNCVNGLCSPSTSIPLVPEDDDDDGNDNEPAPYIYSISDRHGSYAGGRLITLNGKNFAKDQFNRDDPNIGNRVVFTDGSDNITCEVVTYYTTTNRIKCIMGPAPRRVDSSYLAIVTVDGKEVPKAQTCPDGDHHCTFRYYGSTTPYIERLTPDAFVPGDETGSVTMTGRIYTYKVADTQEIGDDVHTSYTSFTLDRFLVGGEQCNPWSEDETGPYGGHIRSGANGEVTCRPETNRIDSMNASIVLSTYGNSQINIPDLAIDNKLRRYLFQTHPDISSVEPSVGSPKGGTLITIYGSHFDDPDGDVKAYVSGVPCQLVNYTSSYITCITGPAPPTTPVYPGGRGLSREVWTTGYTSNLNTVEARPYGYPYTDNWSIQERLYRDSYTYAPEFGESVYINQRYTGFFVPPIDSYYTLNVNSDDGARLYLSPNASRDHKELVAYILGYTTSWNQIHTQISKPIYLRAGKAYYMEGVQLQGRGPWRFGIGAKIHNLSWTEDVADIDYEEQIIRTTSTVVHETQMLSLMAAPRIQSLIIDLNPDQPISFNLTFDGQTTPPLSSADNDTVINNALNSLESIQNIGGISVISNRSADDILELFVIFHSTQPVVPGHIEVSSNVNSTSDTEQGLQLPEHFSLSFGTRSTQALSVNSTSTMISHNITDLFSTKCSVSSPGMIHFKDSYDISIFRNNYGTLDSSVEPYCGRYSIKNPSVVWRYGISRDERTNTVNEVATISPFGLRYVCFAHYGPLPNSRLRLTVRTTSSQTFNFPVTLSEDLSRWNYMCVDVYPVIHERFGSPSGIYNLTQVRFNSGTYPDFWIDEFSITTAETSVQQTVPAVRPNGVFISSVETTSIDPVPSTLYCTDYIDPLTCLIPYRQFTVEYTAHHCGYGMPLISTSPSYTAKVSRLLAGSPPVGGSFDLSFEGSTVYNISATLTGGEMEAALESGLPDEGGFTVSRTGVCSGYSWTVRWTSRPGDHPLMVTDGSRLEGVMAQVSVEWSVDGGVWMRPLRGDMLRLPELNPQVEVSVNGIPASCRSTNCSFTFTSTNSTPLVTGVSPVSGGQDGSTINIHGSNFGDDVAKVTVTIGDSPCMVQSLDSGLIRCIPGPSVAGISPISVHIDGMGYADVDDNVTFTYSLVLHSAYPDNGSISGGNTVMLSGTGLPVIPAGAASCYCKDCWPCLGSSFPDVYVLFGDYPCLVVSSNLTQLSCIVQQHVPATVNVSASVNGVTAVLADEYEYSTDDVSVISAITPSMGPSIGGTTVTITGQRLSNTTSVFIGGSICDIVSVSVSSITCITSRSSPGQHIVTVEGNTSFGIALTQSIIDQPDILTQGSLTLTQLMTNDIPVGPVVTGTLNFTYQFLVTSVTPCSGSLVGGNQLTVKGSGFMSGLSVHMSGSDTDCVIHSMNYNEIKCTLPPVTGTSHTISNNGTDPVRGLYFAWSPSTIEILQGDSITWQWDGSRFVIPQYFEVHQTSSLMSSSHVPGGFRSASSVTGNYTNTFTAPGTYYYTTDVNDACLNCYMSGTVIVRSISDIPSQISVNYDRAIEADFKMEGEESESNCYSCSSVHNNSEVPTYLYSTCDTPLVTEVNPQYISIGSVITVEGTGFTANSSKASITFSDCPCLVQDVYNETTITCRLDSSCQPAPYTLLPLSLLIDNKGHALLLGPEGVVIKPIVTGLSPSKGSVLGGNVLTITGHSFAETDDLTVLIADKQCDMLSVNYTSIQCIVPSSDSAFNSSHLVNVTYSSQETLLCVTAVGGDCYYDYEPDNTPVVEYVSPGTIGGAHNTTLLITGSLLSGQSLVWVGYTECGGVSMTGTDDESVNITCTVSPIQAGDYRLTVLTPGYGYALFDDVEDSLITSQLRVDSISPVRGSTRGGTQLTLSGIGFSSLMNNNSVNISGQPCLIRSSSYSSITCVTPDLNGEGNHTVDVTVATPAFHRRPRREVFNPLIFEYDIEATPTITSVSPTSGQRGDLIVISGDGFSTNIGDTSVSIGQSVCNVTSANGTTIQCSLGTNFVGRYPIDVRINGKGRATGDLVFTYTLIVSGVSPTSGSFAGLNTVTLSGIGFNPVAINISICGRVCRQSSQRPSLTMLSCIVPSFTDTLTNESITSTNCDVVITSQSNTITLTDAYNLNRDLTPTVHSVNRTRGGTAGGSLLLIGGTGFTSTVNVTIAGTMCTVRENTSTSIVCETGPAGVSVTATIMVFVDGKGFAISNVTFQYVDLWSSVYTWGGTSLPVEGDFVIVSYGQTLVLDIKTPILKILLIQGGELIFDDEEDGVELHSENILITGGGLLQIGTETTPYKHKAQIVMYGHRLSPEIPLYGAKTLAVRNGTLDLHGLPIRDTWTRLNATVRPGGTELTVKHNVSDWSIGGKIVLASTSYSQRENEELTITNITNDGYTIHVTPPVSYTHVSLIQTIHGQTIETAGEVGYLTRNVVVRGNRNDEWNIQFADCPQEFKPGQFDVQTCFGGRFGAEVIGDEFGSQIMLHKGPNDRIRGRIEFIEVTHAGQAFRLGRYPIHFHLNGDVSDSYVRGCSIHHTFNRAVTIHAVDNLLVERNVAFNIKGHAYFLEDGIEIGNVIQYNLGVFVRASSSLLNVDITPATFWSVNPNNTFRHNAAAGGTHFGYWYRPPTHPTGPSFTTAVRPVNDPMGEFFNNSAHSFGWYGIWIFQEYYPVNQDTCDTVTPAVFDSLLAWRNDRGIEFSEVGAVQLKNSVLLDNTVAGVEYTLVKAGWGKSGALIENILIIAHSGLREVDDARLRGGPPVCTASGVKTPHTYFFTVSNVTLVNFDEDGCYALRACSHCRGMLQGGFEARFEKLTFTNSPNKVFWQWENENVFRDMDGSLTGQAGGALIPTSGLLPPTLCRHDDSSSSGGVNGSVCDPGLEFVRFAMITPVPSSLMYRDLMISNEHGSTVVPFVLKRLIHGAGYMALLPTRRVHQLDWPGGERFVNISYNALYSGINSSEYLWIRHDFKDVVNGITLNGVESNSSDSLPAGGVSSIGDWYSDVNETTVTYYVNGTNPSCPVDVSVVFSSYQCFYENCIPPPPPEPVTPRPPGRPSVTQMWSNVSIWPDGSLPSNNTDVYIGCDLYVLVDVPLPVLNTLTVCGGLEFLDDRDHVLEANRILIDGGGVLVAGRNETPFQHQLMIILNGSLSSPEYRLPNLGPVLGAKGLGVFGQLLLHGKETSRSWTGLAETAGPGTSTIQLLEPVDWNPGDEIVIAASYYEIGETEERVIASVSNNGLTLTLTQPLGFTHLGGEHNTECCKVNINAEVGLLTRNIKILGTHPNATTDLSKTQSYGCRILVSTYYNTSSGVHTGLARLSGVEFNGCGQEGFVENFDPRFSVSFLNTGTIIGNSSYIRSCSFHNGYSTGIGVFGTDNMFIHDNVIHRSVGPSLKLAGTGHSIINNLAVVALFPGTYRSPEEPFNDEWTANFDLVDAEDYSLIGNSAAGGSKAGFHTNGENCLLDNFTPKWRDNVAHSTLHGIHMGYRDGYSSGINGCSSFHSFKVYSCYHYGFFSYSRAGIIITDSLFVNNYAATFTAVMAPPSRSHVVGNKTVIIKDTKIMSTLHPNGGSVNCTEYSREPIIATHRTSHRGLNRGGAHVGVILTSFVSGVGHFPKAAWWSIISYPAINGLTSLTNVTFCNFATHCNQKPEAAIMTHPGSEDCQHPLWTERISYELGSNASKFFNHNPNLGSINPSDCVDMDCDGLKKILIRDNDGSFLGTGGLSTLVSRSELEWDGDRRRGLGDYRIPIAMLSRPNGSRIDPDVIYPNKGIYRGSSCEFNTDYNSYSCAGIDHLMLVIESLDADTEVRRLSPVGVGADGYIDLINGPQDHGWCGGYTCQERISTFFAIVAAGLNYTIGLTSTNPQNTNFILLHATDSQSLRVAYIYNNPQRLDVYVGSEYIIPTNGYLQDGNLRYRRGENFIPSLTESHGTNYYDRTEKKLYIIVRGNAPVRVETTPVIQLGIDLPPVTVDEFFETNLIQNLALLLGISPNRIRIVNVVSEGGTRRKRQTEERTRVEIEIGDAPSNETTTENNNNNNGTDTGYDNTTTITPTDSEDTVYNELVNITTKVGEVIQTGELSQEIGYMVLDAQITEPQPMVTDPTGGVRATNETGGPQPGDNGTASLPTFNEQQMMEENEQRNETTSIELSIPTELRIISLPSTGIEGIPMSNPPLVSMFDGRGNVISTLGVGLPWLLTASITNGIEGVFLTNGTTSIGNGMGLFSGFTFSHSGTYQLIFTVTYPATANFTVTASTSITIATRGLRLSLIRGPPRTGNTTFPLPGSTLVHVIDTHNGEVADSLGWRGRDWHMRAVLIDGSDKSQNMMNSVPIVNGTASFPPLHITSPGSYRIRYSVYTVPSSPAHELPEPIESEPIEITEYQVARYTVTYNNSYPDIISGHEEAFISHFTSQLMSSYPDIYLFNVSVTEGSIIVSFSATSSNLNSLLSFVESLPKSPAITTLSFRGNSLELVSVSQGPPVTPPPTTPPTESTDNKLIITIISASVSGAVLIAIVCLTIIIFAYNCYKVKARKKRYYRGRGKGSIYGAHSSTVYSNKPIFDESEGGFHTYHLVSEGSGKKKSYAVAMETESVKDAPVEYASIDEKGVELTRYTTIENEMKEKDTGFNGENLYEKVKDGDSFHDDEKKTESNVYTYL